MFVIIDNIDKIAETKLLSPEEIDLKSQSKGDSNTRYFHIVANGRHQKKRIYSVQREGRTEGRAKIKDFITKYYKSLFGAPKDGHLSLYESRVGDSPRVSGVKNDTLTSPFPR